MVSLAYGHMIQFPSSDVLRLNHRDQGLRCPCHSEGDGRFQVRSRTPGSPPLSVVSGFPESLVTSDG